MNNETLSKILMYYKKNPDCKLRVSEVLSLHTPNLHFLWDRGTPQEIEVKFDDLKTFISYGELSTK